MEDEFNVRIEKEISWEQRQWFQNCEMIFVVGLGNDHTN
jgi:hypothetical protein